MLPYLIALDDVIDLPQVVAATCFVADLQQHQAYFLLSQFSRSDSALLSSLKYAERETEMGKGGDGRVNTKTEKTQSGAKREERKQEEGGCQLESLHHLWLRKCFLVWRRFGVNFEIWRTQEN